MDCAALKAFVLLETVVYGLDILVNNIFQHAVLGVEHVLRKRCQDVFAVGNLVVGKLDVAIGASTLVVHLHARNEQVDVLEVRHRVVGLLLLLGHVAVLGAVLGVELRHGTDRRILELELVAEVLVLVLELLLLEHIVVELPKRLREIDTIRILFATLITYELDVVLKHVLLVKGDHDLRAVKVRKFIDVEIRVKRSLVYQSALRVIYDVFAILISLRHTSDGFLLLHRYFTERKLAADTIYIYLVYRRREILLEGGEQLFFGLYRFVFLAQLNGRLVLHFCHGCFPFFTCYTYLLLRIHIAIYFNTNGLLYRKNNRSGLCPTCDV